MLVIEVARDTVLLEQFVCDLCGQASDLPEQGAGVVAALHAAALISIFLCEGFAADLIGNGKVKEELEEEDPGFQSVFVDQAWGHLDLVAALKDF